jgi:adenylate cyclase
MSSGLRRKRVLSLLAAALVAAAVGWAFQATHALRAVELVALDARFDLRGKQKPSPDVVVVAVDARTIAASKNKLPINRTRDADVIGRLAKAGAGVIAYDVQFTEASDEPDADDALVQAVHDAPRVVLGTAEVGPDGTTGIFGGEDGLKFSGATPANTNLDRDQDDRVRRMNGRVQKLTTFAVAAVNRLPGHKVAGPPNNAAWIDYPGPAGTIPTLSFLDVEQGRFDPKAVRGKIVVVGVTAAQANDLHATSTGDSMSGPEIQAAAIATALAGYPLHGSSWWLDALIVLALGALGPLIALRFSALLSVLGTFVGALAFLFAAKLAFDGGLILPVVAPLAAAVVGAIGAVVVSNPERSPLDALLDRLTRGVRGNQRTRRLRALLLLCAAFGVMVVVLTLQETKLLNRIELSSVNERFQIRGKQPPPSDVVLVGVDDKTFAEPPRPIWPFNRADHAKVVRHLSEAGAKVIAYDIQFSEPYPNGKKGDNQLIEATRKAGNVVLATTEVGEHGEAPIFFDINNLSYSRGVPANSNYATDSDGRIRRMAFEIENRESFPMAAARLFEGHPVTTPGGETAWIDFSGPARHVKRLSFVDIRRGTFNPADVKGKVVVIGATAPTLQDFHSTSTTKGGLMPGPEVHANSIATVLAGFPLRSASTWINWLLVIALALVTPFVALRRGIAFSVALGFAALGLFAVGSQLAFNSGRIISVAYPIVAGLLAILLTSAIHGLTVAFEREQARDAFARFVPEAVVDQVLADSDGARLGGVRGEATVMFSDLRGFTSFSETLEPERVIESLNRYLTEMSEAILDHGGTLVAYMGDGIMAVFGAPLKQDDHADRALEAARDMLARMDGFNGWLREQGLHDGFKMGIGLNSGAVMSGNVGSERRLEYTALGDTTNTAARLEGMTKGTPHQLFISDTTKQKLTREVDDLIAVGEAEVRGRKAKVLLWSLRDDEAPAPAEPPSATVEA